MNLKEYAEKEGITLDEAKELTGLTHWKQEVPESCDEIPEVKEDISDILAQSQEVMKMLMKSGDTAEAALAGINFIGNKSKYYAFEKVLKTLV